MTQKKEAPQTTEKAKSNFDAAPWAEVENWDPDRMTGARSERNEEYHADDIAPGNTIFPDKNGDYNLPVRPDGRCAIALAWPTRRRISEAGISFADTDTPTSANLRVEFWEGNSAWQGTWTPLKGQLDQTEHKTFRFTVEGRGQITQKIRWLLSGVKTSVAVSKLTAYTPSPMTSATLVALMENPPKHKHARVKILNGAIKTGEAFSSSCDWDMRSTLALTLQGTERTLDPYTKTDATQLLFELPDESFAVSLDDVLHSGPIYVPRAGLFVSKTPIETTLEEHKRAIASRKTILEEVRAMPEQTREQSLEKTHYIHSLEDGPIMLSLACDNNKFVIEKNGAVKYIENFIANIWPKGSYPQEPPALYQIEPIYGRRRIVRTSQAWGVLGIDAAAHANQQSPPPLKINNKTYAKGLGHHADGEIVIALDGDYDRFECETGVQSNETNLGSVIFQVIVDGEKRFDSGVMRAADPAKSASISLADAHRLVLKVSQADKGVGSDLANWADARLTQKEGKASEYISDFFQRNIPINRKLEGGWLPAPVSAMEIDGVRYTQRTYVTPAGKSNAPFAISAKPLCVLEITVENLQPHPVESSVQLPFLPIALKSAGLVMHHNTEKRQTTILSGKRVVATIDASETKTGSIEADDSSWSWLGDLPANSSQRFLVHLPAWEMADTDKSEFPNSSELFNRFEAYWNAIMNDATQVSIPDEWLNNVIRANQAHIYMAARNEENGARIVPWISSRVYDHAIDSEGNSVIRGMMKLGHAEFARRAFDLYFSRYKPEGFVTTGYTLIGSGWHLRTLAEYLRLSNDFEWLRPRAQYPLKMSRWILAQREKTKRTLDNGERALEWGLMPPASVADWPTFTNYFYGEAQFCSGLQGIGEILDNQNYPEAKDILAGAKEHRGEIERAFRHAQANAPVVPLRNGTWTPFHPLALQVPGQVGDFYHNYTDTLVQSEKYEIELGAQHLAYLGIIDPHDPRITDMLEYMEDCQFLQDGYKPAFPEEQNKTDWFNFGGFGKLQPYYAQIPELYALRDDVKPFLRSYFNTLTSQISKEMLSIFEGFLPFCYNKTHETGYFLNQTRDMLLMERGEELWITPLTPREWLRDGKIIEVKNAPTFFGPTSFRIQSAVNNGSIEIEIDPPKRSLPKAIVLRLRHPEEKEIQSANVSDGSRAEIDKSQETIRIKPSGTIMKLKIMYKNT